MVPPKKKATKNKTAKKKASKKAVKKVVPEKKVKAIKNAFTKSQLYARLSEDTGLARKDIAKVFDTLGDVIHAHIKSRGAGEFKVPGLLKIKVNKKPATKTRKNVPNPFRPGEFMDVAAKPARKVVKILPLKALKDMAAS
ncbi:MAG: DNA-binding protein [Gammaproteobacteria bacterium]|nr:MAG: DNA-binding protein [Gammaproteobacteria bacterium]PCI07524.1 MAG: DNA-binding protein [Gammaproteobacteria bacterium]